jgi:hypothetical protein
MSRIYVDHELLTVAGSGAATDAPARIVPDAHESLGYLADAGHELIVLGPAPVEVGPDGLPVRWQSSLGRGRLSGWYLTADVRACAGARQSGLRTILVGPSAPSSGGPERCDRDARDLTTAALEILATDAMGGTGSETTVSDAAGGP